MEKQSVIKKAVVGALLSLILIAFDQLTKYLAVVFLKGQSSFSLINGVFELRYLENHGAAFGILQNKQLPLLIVTAAAVLVIAWLYLFRIPAKRRYLPLDIIAVFLFSGAIGNCIDRLLHQYVIDFFYFILIDFPIFNVADIYVTASTAVLIALGLFYYKEEDFDCIFPSRGHKS